ncbi:MAG TPA: ATPase, T2SS/T4P/T4SS family [bacterium]|nr:ATPase, T2SS/T4P/T4SS family [bacterium]
MSDIESGVKVNVPIQSIMSSIIDELSAGGGTDFKLLQNGDVYFISNAGAKRTQHNCKEWFEIAESYLFRMNPSALERFRKNPINSIDAGVSVGTKRARVVLTRSYRGRDLTVRILPERILTVQELRLPPQVIAKFREEREGMIVFVGETGSGKTTATASLIADRMAYRKHGGGLLTMEDPIEYEHVPTDKLWVTQWELGLHFSSYRAALRTGMRMHPTDILLQEIRMEPDELTGKMISSAASAVNAAMSGHLLTTSYHAADPIGGVMRIVGEMKDNGVADAVGMLCSVLRMVVSMRLVTSPVDGAKVGLHEVLMITDPIASMLRDGLNKGNLNEVRRKIETNQDGCQSFEESTKRAVSSGLLRHTM